MELELVSGRKYQMKDTQWSFITATLGINNDKYWEVFILDPRKPEWAQVSTNYWTPDHFRLVWEEVA
jgi:hypothetical protein